MSDIDLRNQRIHLSCCWAIAKGPRQSSIGDHPQASVQVPDLDHSYIIYVNRSLTGIEIWEVGVTGLELLDRVGKHLWRDRVPSSHE